MDLLKDYVPPFCPNPKCRHHHRQPGVTWKWHRDGSHQRKAPPREVPRFQCVECRRSFSSQTFQTSYWLHRPELLEPLMKALTACVGLRQAARTLECHVSTLQRQASRLGRHCLLFQQRHAPQKPPSERLQLDGFVTFEFSQYWPFEINYLVGSDTYFVYGFTESELRRSGRMTEKQKARRLALETKHGKPESSATRVAVEDLVRLASPPAPLRITTDEHAAYPRAFARLKDYAIQHDTVSSRRCRTWNNPLFAVDLADLMTRHCSANHKRETIAFSKRRQGAMERAAVFVVWRNYLKRVAENRPDSTTPAQMLGIVQRQLTPADILDGRLFPSHVPLSPPHERCYRRRIRSRQPRNGPEHRLKFAF